jgi:hypothetical protein
MLNSIRPSLLCLLPTLPFSLPQAIAGSPEDAKSIINAAQLTGGVVAHLGAEDGVFSAALRQSDSIVVSGLVGSSDALRSAREHVSSRGLSGPVSFAMLTGKTLPYTDSKILELLKEQYVDLYDADPRFRNAEETITGEKGGVLCARRKDDGTNLMRIDLPSVPVFDGLIAADNHLYISMRNGVVMCFSSGS